MKFKPKPGQVDYSRARWVPVIQCVVQRGGKILLVRRSRKLRFYPNYWSGISGFLDDNKSLKDKVKEELKEEIGVGTSEIVSIKFGEIFDQEEPKYKKTWIVHPVLVRIKSSKIRTDWEAQDFRWVSLREVKKFRLLPKFDEVLRSFFPKLWAARRPTNLNWVALPGL